jgi:hypothetical protein
VGTHLVVLHRTEGDLLAEETEVEDLGVREEVEHGCFDDKGKRKANLSVSFP